MLIFESVLSLQLDFKQHVNLSNSRYLYANSALSLGYLEMPMYSALPCRTMSTSVEVSLQEGVGVVTVGIEDVYIFEVHPL